MNVEQDEECPVVGELESDIDMTDGDGTDGYDADDDEPNDQESNDEKYFGASSKGKKLTSTLSAKYQRKVIKKKKRPVITYGSDTSSDDDFDNGLLTLKRAKFYFCLERYYSDLYREHSANSSIQM